MQQIKQAIQLKYVKLSIIDEKRHTHIGMRIILVRNEINSNVRLRYIFSVTKSMILIFCIYLTAAPCLVEFFIGHANDHSLLMIE